MVGIMVVSSAGYAFYRTGDESSKSLEYKNITFELKEDGLWHFETQGYEFATVFNPKETENISKSMVIDINDYSGKPLYFSYESDKQGESEIIRNIGRFIARAQEVCFDECKENLPVKNCSDNLILVNLANETLIKQENDCIFITAKENDVLRASDAFIFKILKI